MPNKEEKKLIKSDLEGIVLQAVDSKDHKPLKLTIEQLQESLYSGPLPPPEMLEGYKAVYPDAPKIIFDTYEKQVNHRIDIEKKAVYSGSNRATLGTIIGAL